MSRDPALILDIVLAARDAVDFVNGLSWSTFSKSRLHQNAVVRSLEIIGEAAGKLTTEFKSSHPEIPWRAIVNMRHRLIHSYGDVRLDVVWTTVHEDLPDLIDVLSSCLPEDGAAQ